MTTDAKDYSICLNSFASVDLKESGQTRFVNYPHQGSMTQPHRNYRYMGGPTTISGTFTKEEEELLMMGRLPSLQQADSMVNPMTLK